MVKECTVLILLSLVHSSPLTSGPFSCQNSTKEKSKVELQGRRKLIVLMQILLGIKRRLRGWPHWVQQSFLLRRRSVDCFHWASFRHFAVKSGFAGVGLALGKTMTMAKFHVLPSQLPSDSSPVGQSLLWSRPHTALTALDCLLFSRSSCFSKLRPVPASVPSSWI